MANIREVLDRLEKCKAERKIIKEALGQMLLGSAAWVKCNDEVANEKARLKSIRESVLSSAQSDVDELERLNLEIKNDTEVLSDIAMAMFMKGESIEIENKGKKYEPKIKVSFKQMKLI